jgi:hypothetical protein
MRLAYLCLDGWEGRTEERVGIIGETPKRYRIVCDRRIKLAGAQRWLEIGKDVLVPKSAVRFVIIGPSESRKA